MAAQTPTYIPCNSLSFSLNGAIGNVETGGFSPDFETDEMTNNAGYGFYEDGTTVLKCSLKAKVAMKAAAPTLGLVNGAAYPVLINCASMPTITAGIMAAPTPINAGPALAGYFRIKVQGPNVLDTKANVHIELEGMSNGTFSYVL